jgi:Dynamin family
VAEVFLVGPLLASGMCLVDTPGIGSVFAGNTAVTRGFVPHIDAALMVVGADPPISGEELALVDEVARHVDEIILVLNKADRLSERDCDEAAIFAHRTLEQHIGRPLGAIFRVSAHEWLNGINGSGPSRDEGRLLTSLSGLRANPAQNWYEPLNNGASGAWVQPCSPRSTACVPRSCGRSKNPTVRSIALAQLSLMPSARLTTLAISSKPNKSACPENVPNNANSFSRKLSLPP